MQAYSAIKNFVWDDCVDWAYEMMQLGYDTPSLLLLASTAKPTGYFETQNSLRLALKELGLCEKVGEEAIISYSSFYVKRIFSKKGIKESLAPLSELYHASEYGGLIVDFFVLHNAWEDLDFGAEYQWYWEGATRENISHIVVEEAGKWLHQYENQLSVK